MTTVYIAGPMTGIPEFNFPAFDAAAEKYRALGYTVISPAEHDRENGLDVTGLSGDPADLEGKFNLTEALLWDLEQVANADGIVLLQGWTQSSGARAEHALAAALGKWAIEDAFGGEPCPAKLFDPGPRGMTVKPVEVRVTSATGGQKGSKLARFDLIPTGPLTALAEHYGRGAEKYADNNWRLGTDWHLNYAALQRHANAFWGGEDIDAETGSKHITAVAWHAFALAEFMETHPELDTRHKESA